ncbi:TetR/AcrR family transcriptional regulator [Paenibacillus montanisoli]|uniref:TetR/AcrR family transcriptional regulator n=1 Tax=Paenibacillus montanisoli TaxID=2081970 RepID=A0A328U371_9BACL|nr:TetR/AcrR family transcriptional regulator [Paenibacillus montanisoli]RAP75881.1 TetR/AcrR family transcriptional regulator [Paenibacillus montanisoli]
MKDSAKPRTDPRIVRTRQLLKDAFIELLQEMDIEKISVNRIAERATINRVTFYLHYRDIPDMLEKMADDMIEELQAAVEQPPPPSRSSDDIDSVKLVNLLEHIAANAKFYKVVLGKKRTPIFTERLLKMLSESVALRMKELGSDSIMTKAGIQKDIAIWYGSASLIGTIVAWIQHDMPYTPQYLAKQFSLLRRHQFIDKPL